MRYSCARFVEFALTLLTAAPASAVTMDWTPIGDSGNACDPQPNFFGFLPGGCFGSVNYSYNIGTYEVTNAQYAEFLNAKAASDPLGLYHTSMGSGNGGITRSGSSGSYSYSAIAGRENMPVNWVSFFDGARFANWLSNGQGDGDTETGSYTLIGGTPIPTNRAVTRNPGTTIVLPSEDEWYKAAYYDAVSTSYFDYPTGTNTRIGCATPTATANQANCGLVVGNPTMVGSYTGSASPYGTFDQGGNLFEWSEVLLNEGTSAEWRGIHGGAFFTSRLELDAASSRFVSSPNEHFGYVGFRVASIIPEPTTGLLVLAGLLGLASGRRGRA